MTSSRNGEIWKIELGKVENLSNLFFTLQTESQSNTDFWFTCNEKIAQCILLDQTPGDIGKNVTMATFFNGLKNKNQANQYRALKKVLMNCRNI